MTLKTQLAIIRDDLDSRQIIVRFLVTSHGVSVIAEDLASLLIAKAELRKRGIVIDG